MMFKIATVLAVVATFVCEAQAAVATPVQALKPRQTTAVCPLQGNEQFCGWYVDNVRLCAGARYADLLALNTAVDPNNSIYETNASGIPVRFVAECGSGCIDGHISPIVGPTRCSGGLPLPPRK